VSSADQAGLPRSELAVEPAERGDASGAAPSARINSTDWVSPSLMARHVTCSDGARGYRSRVLEVDGIGKSFGPVRALDGVSIRVGRGQMVGFLGPNGAGKSTTMRAILGLLALDAGTITWDGRPIDAAARSRIGYMPADRGLYPSMKVREHVAYFAALTGLSDSAADAAAVRWLADVGLDERADAKVQDLSSGNQQRVQLAVALVHDPELLVLDEPFSGLDPLAVASLKEILVAQVAAGAALLFSSHQLGRRRGPDRDVVIIDRGRVVLSGDVDELRAASTTRYAAATFGADLPAGWVPAATSSSAATVGCGCACRPPATAVPCSTSSPPAGS
jgi:ABC-2 type transport system ATP-binding protein